MAKTLKTRRQEDTRASGGWMFDRNSMPKYKQGDYLRIELLSESTDGPMSVWMCVDHCDDEHAIVFGTIDTESSEWLGKTLTRGARLAASYRQVREHHLSW
jgi:hypothetical protein